MQYRLWVFALLILAVLVVLTACGSKPTVDPDRIRTMAAQTAIAATNNNATSNNTPSVVVRTNEPTMTILGTPTILTKKCDLFQFVSDVTVPDGSVLLSNAAFTKTWRIKNTGSCIWNDAYRIVFVDGSSMSGEPNIPLPYTSVIPGDEVEISVNLVAPSQAGAYRGNWTLRSGRSGSDFAEKLFVQIEVAQISTQNGNFATLICSASWRSNTDLISCSGLPSHTKGSITYSESPVMENGAEENEPSLVVSLAPLYDAEVVGSFPAMLVPPGSHLQGVFSCYNQASACNMRLLITYQVDGGGVGTVGEWQEAQDGSYTNIDINLEDLGLGGKQVRFTFSFKSNGPSDQDKAIFLSPRLKIP